MDIQVDYDMMTAVAYFFAADMLAFSYSNKI